MRVGDPPGRAEAGLGDPLAEKLPDEAGGERGVATLVPVTSSTRSVLRFQTELPGSETGLGRDSKAQSEQVRSVDVEQVGPAIGHVPPGLTTEVDEALRLHLGL